MLDAARKTSALVKSDYFALRLFPNGRCDLPVILSNNPLDFVPVYLDVLEEDFLCEALVERGREYVLRREPEIDDPKHRDFIHAVQRARPISDMAYTPLHLGGTMYGYWALGRAGLNSPCYSDSDLDVFRFIVGFLNDAFRRAFLPDPVEDDTAYLDRRGEIITAGARISEAFQALFGGGPIPTAGSRIDARARFRAAFGRFLDGPVPLGGNLLTLRSAQRRHSFLFERTDAPDIFPSRWPCPCAKVRLLDGELAPSQGVPGDLSPLAGRYGLTPRECEVIAGIYQAKSNKMIAFDLRIDESTVKRHTHNIYEKTGLRSRVELVQGLSFG